MDLVSVQTNIDDVEVSYLKDNYAIHFKQKGQRITIHMVPDEFHKFVSACLETQEIEINQVIKKSEKLLEEIGDLKWKH